VTVAESPTEQMRELALEFRAVVERESVLRSNVANLKARDEKLQDENTAPRRELSDVRQELAAPRQQLLGHVKQPNLSDGRRWTLILALLGAVLSPASGPVVALVRK
jgi:predicted  nucleic acid-binding Zn-ribbon protein